jgi:hypothetical protein
MKVKVSDADRRSAAEVHRLFSAKPHSEHIASEFALAHLAAILRTGEITSVLEFGAGIGTVTYLVLSRVPHARVHCTEHNALCLSELAANLPPKMRERLTIHASADTVPAEPFDLLIIDGKVSGANYVRPGSIYFVEGHRSQARVWLSDELNRRGLTCRFRKHPGPPKISWGVTRMQIPVPIMKRRGCWVGMVSATRP